MRKAPFLIVLAACVCSSVYANGLSVTNASLVTPNTSAHTIQVQFDVSWENSWRNITNRDALWVFVKYSTDSGVTWNHATLQSSGLNPSGFFAGTGTSVDLRVPSDRKGCFVERSAGGAGSVAVSGVRFIWDYAADGLTDSATAKVKVYGIEMVYVPTGSFYIGDGDHATESVRAFHKTSDTAVQISDVPVSGVTVDSNGEDDIDTATVTVNGAAGISGNASWPNGYNAFYLMKYELTEGEWVDFFNTLTPAQKINRDLTGAAGKNTDSVSFRNTISWASGDASTSKPDRACSFLSWMDGCAFADWAALRPLTELEYEKAARGSGVSPVTGEYVWGNTTLNAAANLSGSEDGTETISDTGANANFGNTTFSGGDTGQGSLRAGIFATSISTRQQAGAGYYGNMELSGNLYERTVTLGNSAGRSFVGLPGDGMLTTTVNYEGNATNTDWPGINGSTARGVTGATGSGFRGGSFGDSSGYLSLSDRSLAATTSSAADAKNGFRAARTAET